MSMHLLAPSDFFDLEEFEHPDGGAGGKKKKKKKGETVERFSLLPTVGAPFTLHAVNGAPDGTDRVREAEIRLNGKKLVKGRDIVGD